jgi:hypothetical protein
VKDKGGWRQETTREFFGFSGLAMIANQDPINLN